jgi:aspartate/methionine/tyrosine aminotransferase
VERLELIADTYLSVNTPVQLALGDLLQFAPLFQKQVLDRVLENRVVLEKSLKGIPHVKVWPAEGGWYALTEISKHSLQDEKIVLDLLEKYQVLVQPGGFYDFPKRCFLVLSLLSKKEVFEAGSQRLGQYLAGI